MARDVFGFSIVPNMRRLMSLNGFHGAIMRTDKIKSDTNQLPPGIPIPVLPVDYLKERPNFWIGGVGSYVCPVESDWALWFNWNMNKTSSTAILCSVKGMNPMTGQKVNGFDLINFQEKCPIHNEEFKHGLFCSKCNFKWPDQNYYSFPNQLFCDGFRLPDGTERQFYFTEDMAKSIPEQIIGKDDTVPAFGFCFYDTKEKQKYENAIFLKNKFPITIKNLDYGYSGIGDASGFDRNYFAKDERYRGNFEDSGPPGPSGIFGDSGLPGSNIFFCSTSEKIGHVTSHNAHKIISNELKLNELSSSTKIFNDSHRHITAEVGLGAGSKIEKIIQKSSRSLDEWKEKPSAVIRIYFVFREQFEKYVEIGFNDLEGIKEGYLEGVNK